MRKTLSLRSHALLFLRAMKRWSRLSSKAEVRQWDSCPEPTVSLWIGHLTESIWPKIQNQLRWHWKPIRGLVGKRQFHPWWVEPPSPFVLHYEFFRLFCSHSNQLTNPWRCRRGSRKEHLEEEWWRIRSQWLTWYRRSQIGLQHWIRMHWTAPGHSESKVPVQTAPALEKPLAKALNENTGSSSQVRHQNEHTITAIGKNQLRKQKQSQLTISRKSFQMYDRNWVALKRTKCWTSSSMRWSEESSCLRPSRRQYIFDKIIKMICVQPRHRLRKGQHFLIFRRKGSWIRRMRYLEYLQLNYSMDENDFATRQTNQAVGSKVTRLFWFCALSRQNSWTSSVDKTLERQLDGSWILLNIMNWMESTENRLRHNTGTAPWDPQEDGRKQN